MDVVSNVVGIATATQLASQLVTSVLSIKNFLEKTSQVPSQIRWLTHLCDQVHMLALILEYWLRDGQTIKSQRYHADIITIISNALQTCQEKTRSIDALLRKGNGAESNNLVLRGWARVRLASKSDQLCEIEGELQLSLQVLELAIHMSQFVSIQ
ncbi:hypothetical protein GQ53DRAFT_4502 [Thozetella sp. PMI_491]|nr:hypothetical protein GQ53DRAFT_4502 [Thozetella sp. PMI_491]